MDLGERITESLHFITVFTVRIGGFEVPITETVVVSWVVMGILIVGSALLTRRLRLVPRGPQVLAEAMMEILLGFSKEKFGHARMRYAPYLGTVFLFLTAANLLPVLSPVGGFGFEPAFTIKPPTRDINLTFALALLSISVVLVSGFRARGAAGWFRHLAHPMPLMIPFNLMEYFVRPLSLALRLFGNVLGAFIIMRLIEAVLPIGLPPLFSLYFDILDGLIQALVFTFLTALFVAEAIEK